MAVRKPVLGLAFIIALFFTLGIATDYLPDKSETINLWKYESHSVFIGYAAAGTVISGSYEAYFFSVIEFFMIDSGNYSRWSDGLSYSMFAHRNGESVSFNLTVPYDAKWYAVFQKAGGIDIDIINYEIFVGFLGFRTVVFSIIGLAMAAVIGMFVLLRRIAPRTEDGITELIDREHAPEEVALGVGRPKAPEPVRLFGVACPYCGHGNPRDAEFCIKCGRDLDVTDSVSRY